MSSERDWFCGMDDLELSVLTALTRLWMDQDLRHKMARVLADEIRGQVRSQVPATIVPMTDYVCLRCGRPMGVDVAPGAVAGTTTIQLQEQHFRRCPDWQHNRRKHTIR